MALTNRFTTLISANELAHNLSNPDWVIVDCRHDLAHPAAGHAAYLAGHIPNAQFAQLDDDLAGDKIASDGTFCGRHPLPERDAFIATLRRWGINNHTQIVAYDSHGGMFAARLWWMLRWIGHETVAVLDGGLPAWIATVNNVAPNLTPNITTVVALAKQGSLQARPSLVDTVNADDILRDLAQPSRTIVDARAPDRYRGENETLDPVGGHIPHAANRFFKDNLQADGHFKSAEQLFEEFSALIKDPSKSIMQCGSGVTACHNLLALEIAGLKGAALYPGSWSEWCSDDKRPIARGDG